MTSYSDHINILIIMNNKIMNELYIIFMYLRRFERMEN